MVFRELPPVSILDRKKHVTTVESVAVHRSVCGPVRRNRLFVGVALPRCGTNRKSAPGIPAQIRQSSNPNTDHP
jgi:hypothetical protein